MGRVSMPQGKGSQFHNRRNYEKTGRPVPDNIDSSKTEENIVLVDKDIRQAYQEIFGKALEEYNAKQKRNDRKISSYYDHILKSKNGEKLFYEDVVQWGRKEDFQQNPEAREKAKEALVKYAAGFEKRNKNLKIIGAYIHMDEASPHLHLDYIPVATGYSIGMKTRNSLDRAIKQMGFHPENESRKNNATKIWKDNERAVFGKICQEMGLEVEVERKSDRKSLTAAEYREARKEMIGKIEQEKAAIISEITPLRELKTGIDKVAAVSGKKLPFGVVAIKGENLEAIKAQAKAYTVNRDEIKSLRERTAAISEKEQQLKEQEQMIQYEKRLTRELYNEQTDLNRLYQKEKSAASDRYWKITKLERENSSLNGEIRTLTDQLDQSKAEKNSLTEQLRTAQESLADVVKAIGVLKETGLTKDQERLINAVKMYGVKRTKENGFPEMAKDMAKNTGISKGISKIIERQGPNRGWGMER